MKDKTDEILALLRRIETERNLRVIYACESGSRAWGFASADSDFDVRFIYAYPPIHYLRLRPPPDAFDYPMQGDIDAAGWDLRKAMALLRKSNGALHEWIGSPIAYCEDRELAPQLRELSKLYFDPRKSAFHYLSLARGTWDAYLHENPTPMRKKYLYALRPLACLRFITMHGSQPPTPFGEVMEHIDWSDPLRRAVEVLVAEKQRGGELGQAQPDAALDAQIAAQLAEGEHVAVSLPTCDQPNDALDAFIERAILGA